MFFPFLPRDLKERHERKHGVLEERNTQNTDKRSKREKERGGERRT